MLNPEFLLERSRLKKDISRWRIAAIMLLIGLIFSQSGNVEKIKSAESKHVAKVTINGMIAPDEYAISRLRDLSKNSSISAVIINIDSGGGSPVAAEMYYHAIKEIADNKPVVAVAGQLAASAAYMVGMACDHFISHQYSLVGSIGVVMQTAEITDLAQKLGVNLITVKSSPFKASPNPYEKFGKQSEAVQQQIVDDGYEMFAQMVQAERNLTDQELAQVIDGRLFTGRKAVAMKLIDEIGDENSALEWVSRAAGLPADIKVSDYSLQYPNKNYRLFYDFLATASSMVAAAYNALTIGNILN